MGPIFVGIGGAVFAILMFYMLYRWEKAGVWNEVTESRKSRRALAFVSAFALSGGFAGMYLMMSYGIQMPWLAMLSSASMSLGLYFLFVAIFYKNPGKGQVA
ncbi:MAG: hypothetical protein GXO25_03480 [Euryarchaeota archaeon]|nr:hypothetical protein [Euryarchaeota archaeon]